MEEGRDERIERGRLGRLFAALVGNEDALEKSVSSSLDAAPNDSSDKPRRNEAADASLLDLEALSKSLVGSPNPVGTLRTFAADVRRRAEKDGTDSSVLAPSAFELYLATRLTEAGIDDKDVRLPTLSVVRPRTSNLFYLRVVDDSLPWRIVVALLRIEAALNCALLIEHALEDPNVSSLEEIVRCEQRIFRSIISQATDAVQRADSPALGEWAIRSALSGGIERMRLPYRLTARFRVNAALGTAAIEVDLVPPQAWSSSVYVDGLGVVSATAQMRRRAASDYNLRLGVLLARYALMVAPQLREVWVAGVLDTARDHACYFSARITRSLLEQVDLDGHVDPYALMQGAGAAISAEARELDPVRQTFSLDDERFCPAARYEPVEVSERTLLPSAAEALGCSSVTELGIDEACRRKLVSTELTRSLGTSTEKNVRALLDVAGDDTSPDVREAALRCVNALVEGTLEDDPLAIAEALVSGDALTQETERARALLYAQDMPRAEKHATLAIKAADEAGRYDNGNGTVWHAFGSYTERVLYNLLVAPPHEKCGLVSESYLEAQLIASAAALVQERSDDAVKRAERACEIAPLSAQASLHLAQCLEASGRGQEAFDELCRLLSLAHDPESIGFGYLRMSQLQWREGHVLAAQACYQRACRTLPGAALVAGLAVVALLGQVGAASQGRLSEDAERSALVGEGIPVAPTHEVGEALLAAARAAVDAGIFWVARDLVRTLCSLFRDDVTFGILRSLEDEPRPMSKRRMNLWPPSFDAAIFDFDGTLAATSALWRRVDEIFFATRGLEFDESASAILATLGFAEGARWCVETYRLRDEVQDIVDEWNRLGAALYETSVVLRPGAERYLRALRKDGVPLALATTNNPHVLGSMRHVDVYELFDEVVCGVDVSRGKDHPDIYLEAARRLGAQPSGCLVFEDILPGVLSAREAGMTTVAVRSDDARQPTGTLKREADHWLDDWESVLP